MLQESISRNLQFANSTEAARNHGLQLTETWRELENVLDEIRYVGFSLRPLHPPLMTTPGCFSPYHNSQLLVFRRGLLTQCGRLTAALFVPKTDEYQ